jgi:hypothetical protein
MTDGTYTEYFKPVADGRTWFGDTIAVSINVSGDSIGIGYGSGYPQPYKDAYTLMGGAANLGTPTDIVKLVGATGVAWQPLSNGIGIYLDEGAFTADTNSMRAFVLWAQFQTLYQSMGGPASWLGPPTSNGYDNSNGVTVISFAHGYMYWDAGSNSVKTASWPTNFSTWKTYYYNNPNVASGPAYVADEGSASSLDIVHNDWPAYQAILPTQGISFDNHWSVSWERTYTFQPGTYNFTLCGDDGVRLYLNGTRVIDQWKQQNLTCYPYSTNYSVATTIPIRIEYYQLDGGAGMSFTVNSSQTKPAAPSNLAASQDNTGLVVNLEWVDNATNETGFRVERKTGVAGNWVEIYNVPTVSTSERYYNFLTDIFQLARATTYYYRVRAYNDTAISDYSPEISFTFPNAIKYVTNKDIDRGELLDGDIATTLSYALKHARAGDVIFFGGGDVDVRGSLPVVQPGVRITDGCDFGSNISINGKNAPPGTTGLVLSGNDTLFGFKIINFSGKGLIANGTGNKLNCVSVLKQ